MLYRSFQPSPALKEFVRNYTVIQFQFDARKPTPVKQRSPKAEQKIVFYIQGAVNLLEPSKEGLLKPPPVSVYTHPVVRKSLQITPKFHALIIFLRPGALFKILRMPMSEFVSEFEDAEIFFGTEMRSIREQLAEAKDPAAMVRVAENFLLSKCRQLPSLASVDSIANSLMTDPSFFSMDALADEACLSTRQFYRKFIERIGISPKFFSRLCRFNHAYRYKLDHPAVTWSSIAQEFSYTDYHHLEKEFKNFLGLTPAEWITTELRAPERVLKLR